MSRKQQRILISYLAFWAALVFAAGFLMTWRFAGVLHPAIFWLAFGWAMVLLLLLVAVPVKQFLAPPPDQLTFKTGLVVKPGAATATWVFVLISGGLLYRALAGAGMLAAAYPMAQMVLLAVYIGLMGWRFVDYFIGLPANAGIKAAQNVERLEGYIDQIAYFAASPWLGQARGVTGAGRLRAALLWWEEALVAAFPRQGLEMALPAVNQFLDQLGGDVMALEALHAAKATARTALEDAERRALDGIRRAEKAAGRVLV